MMKGGGVVCYEKTWRLSWRCQHRPPLLPMGRRCCQSSARLGICHHPSSRLDANERGNNNLQPTHQSYSLESLFQSFLSLPLSQDRLQPADELRSKPLRLYMDVLWHAVRALRTNVCTDTITKMNTPLRSGGKRLLR